jgi:hypothetical protein
MKLSRVKTENNTNMKCRDAELLIIDWLASGTRQPLPADLSAHLLSCGSCTGLIRNYKTGFLNIAKGRKTDPDPAFYDNLIVAMQQSGMKNKAEIRPGRILLYSPALAAAAASVILGVWIGSRLIYPALQVNNSENIHAVADGSALIQEYANDLNPEEDFTLVLEGYLTENENTGGDVAN